MTRKETRPPTDPAAAADALEPLYRAFLHAFYETRERDRAAELAPRLQAVLDESAEVAGSIRGDELRALLAELAGDLDAAIAGRERELRRILQLHSIAVNKPGWDRVLSQYDHRDVADRLDLLGILYAEAGQLDRAVATLEESRRFCGAHDVVFDGEDLLAEYLQQRADGDRAPAASHPRSDP